MQLLAIGLAASLLFGPAPTDAGAEAREAAPVEPAPAPEPAEAEPAPAPEPVEAEPAPAPEPMPEQPVSSSEAPPPAPRDRLGCAGSKPCRRMSIAGIMVGTIGLTAVGAGIGLLLTPDKVLPEAPAFVMSTRPAGLVSLTVGAGVALTAVLMLVASHRGYKQRDDQARRLEFTATGLRF